MSIKHLVFRNSNKFPLKYYAELTKQLKKDGMA